jgi:quercetin dioxygenase-like cupin family protein
MTTRLDGYIEKGWGHEFIFATNELYCGKLMKFNKGAKFSMHFHKDKDETWYVMDGKFKLHMIRTDDASHYTYDLVPGDVHRIYPLQPHQLECIEEGTIIEVSTPDSVADNFRIMPGDSQK